jgi:hypothetical protein
MILKKLLLCLIVFSSFEAFAQLDRISAQKDLILSDTLSPEKVMLQMLNYKQWGTDPVSAVEWDQIKNILLSKNTQPPSLRDQYFICYADCNKYAQLKQIGEALYCIESFYKKVKSLNDDEQLMKMLDRMMIFLMN